MSPHLHVRENLKRCEGCANFRSQQYQAVVCAISEDPVMLFSAGECPLHGGSVPKADRVEPSCTPISVKGESVSVRVVRYVPHDQWPLWARAIERMRKPDDIGVGTTWERELAHVGTAIKAALKLMKIPCGCAKRKAEWDVMYRY